MPKPAEPPALPFSEIEPVFRREGLELVGVAPAEPNADEERRYRERIAAGRGAGMGWLARHAPLKFSPALLLAGCRSVIVAGLGYQQERPAPSGDREEKLGSIARYAWGRDYHRVLGDRLRHIAEILGRRMRGERFAAATDATPLAERYYGERSGIGFTGRHGLLISRSCGSWFVIGEILTTASIEPGPSSSRPPSSCPASCRRCLAACPTGALEAPYRLDARRCISYLTIENREGIPVELRKLMGDRVFGCDACQEACPFNARVPETTVRDFLHHRAGASQELRALLALRDQAELQRRFAGSPLGRAGRRGLVRNACVAAANTGATELLGELRGLRGDPDPVVAEHAAWAAAVLEGREAPQERTTGSIGARASG